MEGKNNDDSDVIVIYRRYKTVNGKRIYPKKAKVFKIVLHPKSA